MFRRRLVSLAIVAVAAGVVTVVPSSASTTEESYIVVYRSSSQVHADQVRARGAQVVIDLSKAGLLAVRTSSPAALQTLPGVVGVAKDRPRFQAPKEHVVPFKTGAPVASPGCANPESACPLQWDLTRTDVPQAWSKTMGSAAVKVAVLDTGLTSKHEEVGSNYDKAESKSFVTPNPFCPADGHNFKSTEDFYGHGTWTSTHVAGVNGAFMTGIAPKATLVNIRVLGACGIGLDSWILAGMLYGNQIGAKVESMSIGGFLCGHGVVPNSFYCGTPADVGSDPLIWQAFQQVVSSIPGTLVVAAAGNEHLQLDARGQVISHGTLGFFAPAPDPRNDFFGLTEIPGGLSGVVAVGAVNRLTAPASEDETVFGQAGAGKRDQLTYYSNYGEKIDVSAPGGARNYNVPRLECLSASCSRLGPSSPTAADNPGDFGAWGVDATGDPCRDCYVFVQGTSIATPQVAGIAVLALSVHPNLPTAGLVSLLRSSVTSFTDPNATPPIAQDPSMETWNFSLAYGQPGVRNSLMGRGVIDAARAVGA